MSGAVLLLRVLSTEVLKLKRTLALWMVLLSPLVVVELHFLILFLGADRVGARPGDQWLQLVQNTLGLWTVLMMPMFLALETALLAGLEHTDKNWKSLLALPPPRWMFYVSKWLVVIGMLWGAHLVLTVGTLATGAILREFKPVLHIDSLRLAPLVPPMLKISAAALLALSIQHWVSLRWPSFTTAFGFGMCAMVIGFVTMNSTDFGPWFPWSMSMHALRPRPGAPNVMAIAIAAAFMVVSLGAWDFSRREIAG
jgi:lantibiotic transport system permease protein